MALRLTIAAILAAIAAGVGTAQPARVRTSAASVAVVVRSDGRASVEARYDFRGNPGAMSFEYLARRCARVGPIVVASNGVPVPYAQEVTAPWVRLHDTTSVDPSRSSLGYTITYDVELLARDVDIPLVLPMATLSGSRRGAPIVTLTVELPRGARVTLPRLERTQSAGRWSGRLVALPSVVRTRLEMPNASCPVTPATAGSSGRFTFIFWSLVATLAVWVPVYLWWANRQRQQA